MVSTVEGKGAPGIDLRIRSMICFTVYVSFPFAKTLRGIASDPIWRRKSRRLGDIRMYSGVGNRESEISSRIAFSFPHSDYRLPTPFLLLITSILSLFHRSS